MAIWSNFVHNKGILPTQSQFHFYLEDIPLPALLLVSHVFPNKRGKGQRDLLELVKIPINPQP